MTVKITKPAINLREKLAELEGQDDNPTYKGLTVEGATTLEDSLSVTGTTTLAGASTTADITFGDNDKAIFGDSSDLQIYHDGGNSRISDFGTGDLLLQGTAAVRLRGSAGEMVWANDGADVRLYHNGSTKLTTTSTGVDVTGDIAVSGGVYLGGTGSANHLDDYETGTWTPFIGGGAGSLSLNATNATYTKVGRFVYVTAEVLTWTSKTAFTASAYIAGLPFATRAGTRNVSGSFGGATPGAITNCTGTVSAALDGNVTAAWIIAKAATNNTYFHLSDTHFNTSGTIYGFSMVYETA